MPAERRESDRLRAKVQRMSRRIRSARDKEEATSAVGRRCSERFEAAHMSHKLEEFVRCERMQRFPAALERRCPRTGPHNKDPVMREQAPRFPQ